MFQGFTPQTQEFLWGITLNNERGWFEEHRALFESALRQPFTELARETAGRLQAMYPDASLQLHIARIYRDARRLYGRGPYKDHLWFSLKASPDLLSGPMFWFEIGAAAYSCGVGFYDATPLQMEAFRKGVDANPARLETLATKIAAQDRFQLEGEFYARPKGDKGALLNPWYNRKRLSLCYEDNFGGDLFSPELPDILARDYDFLMPCYEYLESFDIPEYRRQWRDKR